MDPYENPFRPGAGSPPPALIGRQELIDRFEVAAERALRGRPDKSLMPIGRRGVGKTVLLNRFAEVAEAAGYSIAFIEAPETADFRVLLAVRLRKVLLALDRKKLSRKVVRAMGVLKAFTLQLPDGSSIAIDVEAVRGEADTGDLASDVTDLMAAVGEACAAAGSGLLVAVDEVQYLSSDELGALITAIHRTTQRNLPVVLVGAGLPQLPGIADEAKSYAERLFDFPEIGSLEGQDARDAIIVPMRDADVEIDDDAVDLLVAESRGYPYFLQEWGSHVWNEAAGSPIRRTDVAAARAGVIDQLDRSFSLVCFDRLTRKEKEYLRAMAALGPGPHRSGDIAAELGVKVESVAPRRSALIAKGMIYSPAHGDTAFTVPLFDEYLERAGG